MSNYALGVSLLCLFSMLIYKLKLRPQDVHTNKISDADPSFRV